MKYLPQKLLEQLQILRNLFASKTDRVYMVGGAVRDLLRREIFDLDIVVNDLDIEVFGVGADEFEELMHHLGAKGVGKSFFVYKWGDIDIALPRVEQKIAKGHRGFRVKLAFDEKEASKRRDFRMNALMLNIFDGRLLDFWGGIDDIIHKRIAIIDEEKFAEDSLRVLRAMQFASRFGYKIEPKSAFVMQRMDLDDLSSERIFWEFEKMFKGEFLHYGLYYLITLKIERKIFGVDTRELFFKSALEMVRNKDQFEKELYKFYFLYIYIKNQHRKFEPFLEKLHTPKEYFKAFKAQKYLPKIRTDRFLAALALRYPLKKWLGNYAKDVKIRAKRFGFWDERFCPVLPKELLKEGFFGEALGKELRRRSLMIIRKKFKGYQ